MRRSALSIAAETLLGPFGIRRKRPPRDPNDRDTNDLPDGSDTWEIDMLRFLSAASGAAIVWWALWSLRDPPDPFGKKAVMPSGGGGMPRVALSEFLLLLRSNAVKGVTYLADRPPAGALIATLLATALPELGTLVPPVQESCQTVETLLLPGCHQSLFEELRTRDIMFECAEAVTDVDPDMGRLSLLIDIAGLLASIGALVYFMRGSNQGHFSGQHLEDDSAVADRRAAVTFDDVAGMETTKEELREVISYLRDPESFYALGARPPRGILLTGPSGTGKTLMARAVAGEAGVPFLYASSAAFVELYVGQGAQRVRQFFEQARDCAPCIVFLDEVDAVGASRQSAASCGNQEYAQTLNQLLLELDGIESHWRGGSSKSSRPVVVTIAATNRYDCLDEAFVRPGRLDRIVLVGLPTLQERVATLQIHAAKLQCEGLDFLALAKRAEGQSGAELAGLLNEAALLAARRRADAVRMEHVEEVMNNPRPKQGQPVRQTSEGPNPWDALAQAILRC